MPVEWALRLQLLAAHEHELVDLTSSERVDHLRRLRLGLGLGDPHHDRLEFQELAELVLEEAAVVVSPGSMYGPSGEGFFRIALTAADERIEEAVARMREHLG